MLAILTHILRSFPENAEIVENVLFFPKDVGVLDESLSSHFVQMLKHSDPLLRERMCYFLRFLARTSKQTLQKFWDNKFRETVETLMYDSLANVRNVSKKIHKSV